MVYPQSSVASTLTPEIDDYIISLTLANRDAAYFKLTIEGNILDWGGSLEHYGIQTVEVGQLITQHLFFIDALLPLQENAEQLFCIKFNHDHPVDLHLFSTPESQILDAEQKQYWVLLLDATQTETRYLHMQQKSNEFNLLRQRYAKLLQGDIRRNQACEKPECIPLEGTKSQPCALSTNTESSSLDSPITGLSKAQNCSSILIIKCNLSSNHAPTANKQLKLAGSRSSIDSPDSSYPHLKQLNKYLAIIAQIVSQQGGLIHHVFGDTAVALFGLLPACQSAPKQANDAAKQILLKCQDLAETDRPETEVALAVASDRPKIGAAITTGQSTAGVIQSQGYRAVHTLGDNVERALCLSQWICPGVILIDDQTFEALEQEKQSFDPSLLVSKHNPIEGKTFYAQELCSW